MCTFDTLALTSALLVEFNPFVVLIVITDPLTVANELFIELSLVLTAGLTEMLAVTE